MSSQMFDGFAGWWRSARLAAVGGALGVVGLVLVGQLGTPAAQLLVLRRTGDASADPVACVLALLTLIVESLVAYLLVVLVLRSLSTLPGTMGRLATRSSLLVTPLAVRRTLDLLVGGVLLAQATLAFLPTTPPGHRSVAARTVIAATFPFTGSWPSGGSLTPVTRTGKVPAGFRATTLVSARTGMQPVDTRPIPRRSSAPLPPWLGGGPSMATPEQVPTSTDPTGTNRPGTRANPPGTRANPPGNGDGPAAPGYVVEPHDTLWDIAAGRLGPAARSAANIHRYWQQVYRANRPEIGANPDLIHPGLRLDVPPYRRGHR
jgi:hypothetical protein